MNNDDLERELRAQAGPLEVGYQPIELPATLEAEPRRSRPVSAGQMALVGAAVLAGAALAIALTRVPQPAPSGVGSGGSARSSATASPSPTADAGHGLPPDCVAGDFAWSTDPWGGAAGSRGTSVLLRHVTSPTSCFLSGRVSVQIRDANGQVLVSNAVSSVRVARVGDVLEIGIAWSNWCGQVPAQPLSAVLQLPRDATEVPLIPPVDAEIPVPPCNGEGQPSNLSVTEVQPSTRTFPDG